MIITSFGFEKDIFLGRDNQNILKSMEILNIEAAISQVHNWRFVVLSTFISFKVSFTTDQ